MSIFVLMLTTCDSKNNNLLYHSMNRLVMLNSDEETAIIVLVMDSLVRKIRSASRIPKQVSTFIGQDRMMNLLQGHNERFFKILRMPKVCFLSLCSLLEENGVRDTRSLTVKEQLMMFLIVVGHCDSSQHSGYEWNRSTETVSRHFNNICSHLVSLAPQLIGPPTFDNFPQVIA